LVEFAKRRAAEEGVAARVKFDRGDIFETDFSEASVITSFLLPSMNYRLRPTFLKMKPGTRIVANTFGIGDWEPDDTANIDPCERWCKALLWIVPARVGGTWQTPHGDLTVTQRYQVLTGSLGSEPVREGRLRGEEILLEVGDITYRGTVDGTRMRVHATGSDKEEVWRAVVSPFR
jgi:hypothetical protein